MAGLIQHQGEKGDANENSVQLLLAKVLPPSVRVATGEIIDSMGTASAQMDTLVLSNTVHPTLFAQTEEKMFPVESVLLCIEVKTTLTQDEVADISKKVRKHQKLSTNRKPYQGRGPHHPARAGVDRRYAVLSTRCASSSIAASFISVVSKCTTGPGMRASR
ncbi:DUF6602 domain-containing protein [Paenarthrobacter sp. TAF1]|uniref:DUF6602 domain-containing protein n=1 Tax=Paenarthrobacter sp. TAF1 TaxID=3233067 RepID=UPI003F98E6A9